VPIPIKPFGKNPRKRRSRPEGGGLDSLRVGYLPAALPLVRFAIGRLLLLDDLVEALAPLREADAVGRTLLAALLDLVVLAEGLALTLGLTERLAPLFELRALDDLALRALETARPDLLLVAFARLLLELRRERRTDLFHPSARSARKEAGMFRIWSESSTESAAASARSARTSAITFDGRRARAAWTRLVSRTTNICRSGSIQIEVPV